MDSRLVVSERELRSLAGEKTIVLAILTQLVVAAFSTFLLVGLVTVYSPGAAGTAIPLTVGVSGNATEEVVPVLREHDIGIQRVDSRAAGRDRFTSGDFDATLHAVAHPAGNLSVEIVAPEGELRATVTVARLKAALAELERTRRTALADRLRTTPLDLPDPVPGGAYVGFTYTVLVPLLIVMPVFISGSIMTDSLTEELTRGTAELLRVAPISPAGIVDGKALAATVLAPAQVALWFGFLSVNDIPIGSPWLVLLATVGLTLTAVTIGTVTALLARERRGAQLLYAILVLATVASIAVIGENPVNTIARLSIGTASSGTEISALVLAGVGAMGYLLVRSQAERLIED